MPAWFCSCAATTGVRHSRSRQELVRRARHAPADHEQVGPQQSLERLEIGAQPLGPLLPAEVLPLAHQLSRQLLRVDLVLPHLEVPELGVRDQHPVGHERTADPRPEREQHDHPGARLGMPEARLGLARGIGIVDHRDRAPRDLGEQGLGVDAQPLLVDVGRGVDGAALHHTREGHPHLCLPREVRRDLPHHFGHRVGCGRVRRLDPEAVGGQRARRQVDDGALDPRAADVDAQCLHGGGPLSGRAGSRTGPVSEGEGSGR